MDSDGSSLIDFFENHDHRIIHKWMHYFEIYDKHFSKFRNRPVSLIEFGVSHGGSLQMWRDYLGPQAKIYGADVNPLCASIQEPNVQIFIGDQEDRQFLRSIKESLPKFDIIIDDGGHMMGQQIATFEELYPHLNEGGVYLCEDVHTSYFQDFGGGYRNPGSFMEYAKRLIDQLHAWYSQEPNFVIDQVTLNAYALHFYDSIIVIDKRAMKTPHHRMRGTPSFPIQPWEQQLLDKG
jgi:cephalosporin hydroxylase